MELGFTQRQARRVLKQRNILAGVAAGSVLAAIAAGSAALSRDREVILQPVISSPVTVSSSGVSKQYLELITRDASVMLFNRTPSSLEYWMDEVLKIVDPAVYGEVKGELIKLANDQRGSSVVYFFTPEGMNVDTDALTSEITGVLHTMVGRSEVSAIHRTYRFVWSYRGLELRLRGFGVVEKPGDKDGARDGAKVDGNLGSSDGSQMVR